MSKRAALVVLAASAVALSGCAGKKTAKKPPSSTEPVMVQANQPAQPSRSAQRTQMPNRSTAGSTRVRQPMQRQYLFHYYPDTQIYYSPQQDCWHWVQGKQWQSSPTLPAGVATNLGSCVVIDLSTARPQDQHQKTMAAYPSNRVNQASAERE